MDWVNISQIVRQNCIEQLGATGSLRRTTAPGTFDPNTGSMGSPVISTFPVLLVLTGRKDFFEAGGIVKSWSGSAVIAAGGEAPRTTDTLVLGAASFTIGEVNPVCPDGSTVISYDVELRG